MINGVKGGSEVKKNEDKEKARVKRKEFVCCNCVLWRYLTKTVQRACTRRMHAAKHTYWTLMF